MYGYNHTAEYERLRNAAEQGEKLIREILQVHSGNVGGENPAFSAWEILRLATLILDIRRTVTHDGSGWEQRPIDMLARSHIDVEGEPSEYAKEYLNTKEKKFQLALDRCKCWEETCLLFQFEKDFSDRMEKREKNKKMEGTLKKQSEQVLKCAEGPMKKLFSDMKNLRSKQKKERITYDIFDNAISYTERIARWQEDTVWGLSGLRDSYAAEDECSIVTIPDRLYIDLIGKQIEQDGNSAKVQPLIRLSEFCAMLYRHLKGMGVTKDDLSARQGNNTLITDYWALPGKSAFGSYQNDVQADSFFDSVEKLIRSMDNSPVRLLKINDRWMAWMDRNLFLAFKNCEETIANTHENEEAKSREKADERVCSRSDDPKYIFLSEEEKFEYWLSKYRGVQKKRAYTIPVYERAALCGENLNEGRKCLTVADDGSYLPCASINAYISDLYRQETGKAKDPEMEWFSLFKKKGSQSPSGRMWTESGIGKRTEWLKQAIDVFKEENDIIKLKDGKTIAFPLRMIKDNQYGKTVKRNSSCLLIGFCCYVNHDPKCVLLDPDVINQNTFTDAGAEAFQQYCNDAESGKLQLYVARTDKKKLYVTTAEIDEEERELLRSVLKEADTGAEFGTPEKYNHLFEKALALAKPIHDLKGKCSVEYLNQWKSGNDLANLKSFAQRVLYWHAMSASRLPDNFYELRELWQNDEDVRDFLRINRLMTQGWIKTRVIYNKHEPGRMDLQKICIQLTEEESALMSALCGKNGQWLEYDRQMENAWHHLIHLGMLVLWNKGFADGSEGGKKKRKEVVFNYNNPLANTNTGDDQALCFLMFAIHCTNKMQAGTNIVCQLRDEIWYFDDKPLQISSAEWNKFREEAERIRCAKVKLGKAYIFHDIQPGEHQLKLSIVEQEKNVTITGQKKKQNPRGKLCNFQPDRRL